MFDVTNFLMRWLFLSNLIRDSIDIQTLPYNPPVFPATTNQHHQYHNVPPDSIYNYHPESKLSSSQHSQRPYHHPHNHNHYPPSPPSLSTATSVRCEDEWRDHCMRGIASYPPGTQRLLILDAMRAELVEQLSWSLQQADQTVEKYAAWRRRERELEWRQQQQQQSSSLDNWSHEEDDDDQDPFMDADMEILKAFEQETKADSENGDKSPSDDQKENVGIGQLEEHAVFVISNNGTIKMDVQQNITSSKGGNSMHSYLGDDKIPQMISSEQAEDAQRTIRVVRDYLPQLVSVVLKSPSAFDPNLIDPVNKLRQIILRRCVEDANWGVDMCWLLEAEVGRAWKTLFEHRQQTGRRLIVVLPAEKAAVLAKIGSEKREAFDLLQDAEQATAFGYTLPLDEDLIYHGSNHYSRLRPRNNHQRNDAARLPSSLSLRRCSHFGDTMHFIDRLTKVSLDLRRIPRIHRHVYLENSLREVNRRVRRRMVTRGDVSLDVEDHRGPDDWPVIADVTADMLRYSVHLPIDPKQNKRWPGGATASDVSSPGAVRVLNIVVEEGRILASRERCPYLVHLEVAETGLRGSDTRLYASGAPGIGTTIEEALALSVQASSATTSSDGSHETPGSGKYHIPSELLFTNPANQNRACERSITSTAIGSTSPERQMKMPRGGWQADEAFYSHNPEDIFMTNPYDSVRQNEYQELHEQLHSEYGMIDLPPQPLQQRSQLVSTREVLLDQVFGQPWTAKCEEIRQASPYGKVQGWRLASFIVKAGEDIRREALVMQIITKLNEWFTEEIPESDRPSMRPYTIMCVGGDAGIVECLSDAKSLDELKKRTDNFVSLRDYFERAYGPPTTHSHHYGASSPVLKIPTFEEAQENFLRSLVGYSVVCYILQIKDRHNANILMDREGHIMHIDFGYVLGDTPKMGKVPIFSERAPFKLSGEFWDVLGGFKQGGLGVKFLFMFQRALECASAHADEIESLVEATMLTLTQNPRHARSLAAGVKNRLRLRGGPGSKELQAFVIELVNAALTSWGTTTYDWLQKNMNGYE